MGLGEYGPYALPLAIISILAQVIWTMTKRKNGNGSEASDAFRQELRNDIKDVKRNVHEIHATLQALVTKVALTEYRVTRLEDVGRREP